MGRTIEFHPREDQNKIFPGTNNSDGKTISINQTKEDPAKDNGSSFDITKLFASKSDGASFDMMDLLASQNPEFEKRQKLIEKYKIIKKFQGAIKKRVYDERSDSLWDENIEDLEKTADHLSIEELQTHPSYAIALFHTIFRKRKNDRNNFY